MADHGPAKNYLEYWVERGDVLIYISGYNSPDTLGYKLQHPIKQRNFKYPQVNINGKVLKMKAQAMATNEFSSHAKADEIIDFLLRFKCLNLLLINHGQKEVMARFAERTSKETTAKQVGILGEYTYRISCYGYVKHMGSKLFFNDINKEKIGTKKEKAKRIKKSNKNFVRRNHKI